MIPKSHGRGTAAMDAPKCERKLETAARRTAGDAVAARRNVASAEGTRRKTQRRKVRSPSHIAGRQNICAVHVIKRRRNLLAAVASGDEQEAGEKNEPHLITP